MEFWKRKHNYAHIHAKRSTTAQLVNRLSAELEAVGSIPVGGVILFLFKSQTDAYEHGGCGLAHVCS